MPDDVTVVAGIVIPSTSPVFLGLVAAHVLFALAAVICGAAAMFSRKGPGRHPLFGTIYYWSLATTFGFSLILTGVRWSEDYPLAILGALASAAATLGRAAGRGRWSAWIPFHVGGMAASYILMITAFYVNNGKNLPLWRAWPPIAYWFVPAAVGAPVALWSISRRMNAERAGVGGVTPPPLNRQ